MKRKIFASYLISGLIALLSSAPASAYTVENTTVPAKNKRVKLPVRIYLPDNVQGKVPAVMLLHGSGGANKVHEIYYAKQFETMGVATIAIDSFSPRRIRRTVTNQSQLPMGAMRNDALEVLQSVTKNPHIDGSKVVLMGFSKGAGATLQAALKVFYKPGEPRFAMFIAMYPPCNTLRLNPKTTGKPIKMLVGEKDINNLAASCTPFKASYKEHGANISLVTIPDAQHAWEVSTAPRHFFNPKGENYNKCLFVEVRPHIWIEKTSNIEIANRRGRKGKNRKRALAKCLTYGVGGGYNSTAAAQSSKLIKDYVLQVKTAGK